MASGAPENRDKKLYYPWVIDWGREVGYVENILNQQLSPQGTLADELSRSQGLNRVLRLHPHSQSLVISKLFNPPRGYKYNITESDMNSLISLLQYRLTCQYQYYHYSPPSEEMQQNTNGIDAHGNSGNSGSSSNSSNASTSPGSPDSPASPTSPKLVAPDGNTPKRSNSARTDSFPTFESKRDESLDSKQSKEAGGPFLSATYNALSGTGRSATTSTISPTSLNYSNLTRRAGKVPNVRYTFAFDFDFDFLFNFDVSARSSRAPLLVLDDFEFYKTNNPSNLMQQQDVSQIDADGQMQSLRRILLDVSSAHIPDAIRASLLENASKNVSNANNANDRNNENNANNAQNEEQKEVTEVEVILRPIKLRPVRIQHLTFALVTLSPKAIAAMSRHLLDSAAYPHLTRLNLTQCGMTDVEADRLSDGLAANTSLISFRVHRNRKISAQGWQYILNSLQKHQHLQTLSVIKNGIDDDKFAAFAEYLGQNPNLKRIYFDENIFSNNMCAQLGHVLSVNTNLFSLNLKRCGIGAQYDLIKRNPAWDAKDSKDSKDSAPSGASGTVRKDGKDGKDTNEALGMIKDGRLDRTSFKTIADFVAKHALQKNEDEKETSGANGDDADDWIEMPRLGYICYGIGLNLNSKMTFLDLWDNRIEGRNCGLGLKFLCMRSNSLGSLSLFQNKLGDEGVNLLCEGLLENRKESSLFRLRLGNNGLSRECCKNVAKVLDTLNNLNEIELNNNPLIGDPLPQPTQANEQDAQNAQNAQNEEKVQEVHVEEEEYEKMKDTNGVCDFAEGLPHALHLQKLNIGDCIIGPHGALALRDGVMKQHQNVTEMHTLSRDLLSFWMKESNKESKQNNLLPIPLVSLIIDQFVSYRKIKLLSLNRCFIHDEKEAASNVIEVMTQWHEKKDQLVQEGLLSKDVDLTGVENVEISW